MQASNESARATTSISNRTAVALVLVLLAGMVFSHTLMAAHFSNPATYSHQIASLDEKKETVAKLAASSFSASAVITLIPGDTATPIANQLAEVGADCSAILCVILAEKYLLTITGFIFFAAVVPTAFAGMIIALLIRRYPSPAKLVFIVSIHLLVIGFVAWALVPTSVFVSDKIEETYQASVNEAIDVAATMSVEDNQADCLRQNDVPEGFFARVGKFFFGSKEDASATAPKNDGILERCEQALYKYVEGFAVMVATCCIVPLLVPLFAFAVGRTLLRQVQRALYRKA